MLNADVNVQLWSRPEGGCEDDWVLEDERHNLVTDDGVSLLASMLAAPADHADGGIRFCEVGTSATAPDTSDTRLATPHRRTGVNEPQRSGDTLSYQAFFPSGTIKVNLREMGLWAGPDSTIGIGTGVLFARSPINHNNLLLANRRDLRVIWAVTVKRAA